MPFLNNIQGIAENQNLEVLVGADLVPNLRSQHEEQCAQYWCDHTQLYGQYWCDHTQLFGQYRYLGVTIRICLVKCSLKCFS